MQEFATNLSAFLTGGPTILKVIGVSALGALCACIVLIYKEQMEIRQAVQAGKKPPIETPPMLLLGRFVVSWLTGCFLGPLFAPGIQQIVKVSEHAVTFCAGGGGYIVFDKWVMKKAENIGDEPPANQSGS